MGNKQKTICFLQDAHGKDYTAVQSQQLSRELEIILKMIFFRVRREQTGLTLLNEETEPTMNCNSKEVIFLSFLLYSGVQEYKPVNAYWLHNNIT